MVKLPLLGLITFGALSLGQEVQPSTPNTNPTKPLLGISEVKFTLEDKTETVLKSISIKQPNKLDGFKAEKGQILRIHFFANQLDQAGTIQAPAKLDLAVMLVNHTGSGTVTYLPFGTSKPGSYRLNLGKKNFPRFIQANPGAYDLTLVLAATEKFGAIRYPLGEINFITPKVEDQLNKIKRYGPRPTIHHQFRKPDPLPHVLIPISFTGLLLIPWGFLIYSWTELGANISEFPLKHLGHTVAALGFFATLVANIALSYYYWLSLTLFPTLAIFVALNGLTVLSGRFALDHVQNRRNMTLQ